MVTLRVCACWGLLHAQPCIQEIGEPGADLFMSGLKIHNNQVCDPDEHGLIAHDGQTIGSKLGKGRESEASQDTDLAALVLSLVAQRLADGCLW